MLINQGKKTKFLIYTILGDTLMEEVTSDDIRLFRRIYRRISFSLYIVSFSCFPYNDWILGTKNARIEFKM